jgi:hypothetical protein
MAIFSVKIGRELKEKLVRIVIFLEGAEELFKKGVEELDLRNGHGARERYLHEMAFCDGIVDVEVTKKGVEKVKKYIAYVKSLLKFNQCT